MSELKRLQEAEVDAFIEHQEADDANVQATWDAWMLAKKELMLFSNVGSKVV